MSYKNGVINTYIIKHEHNNYDGWNPESVIDKLYDMEFGYNFGESGLQENYENLANAIIEYAARDYRLALEHMYYMKEKANYSKEEKYRRIKDETKMIEKFFMSDYFKGLTTLDGSYILKGMREMALDNYRKGKRRKNERKEEAAS